MSVPVAILSSLQVPVSYICCWFRSFRISSFSRRGNIFLYVSFPFNFHFLVIFTAHFQGILKYRGRKRIFTMSLLISYNAFNTTRIIQRPLSAVATVNEAIDSEWNITTGLFGLLSTMYCIKRFNDFILGAFLYLT